MGNWLSRRKRAMRGLTFSRSGCFASYFDKRRGIEDLGDGDRGDICKPRSAKEDRDCSKEQWAAAKLYQDPEECPLLASSDVFLTMKQIGECSQFAGNTTGNPRRFQGSRTLCYIPEESEEDERGKAVDKEETEEEETEEGSEEETEEDEETEEEDEETEEEEELEVVCM
ncbi:uncharacterized protein C53C9.2-like [Rhinatrema bivittatum]|uniref:uncharacterized protein C53C9.2-like n=1 Tax=Rhinatrema bivittatum TaxID=194408 RepID=UPI001129E2D6|nr:uncharacterized protein C53C9.2-like [Rhinatrema bivittatum]